MSNNQALVDAIVDMREDDALQIAQSSLDAGTDPQAIINDCSEAMDIIGKRFEEGDCFVPELIMAGEILNQITEMVKPKMTAAAETNKLGKVVFGTVEGDIHDIAKDAMTAASLAKQWTTGG